jgi:hypothetical protein
MSMVDNLNMSMGAFVECYWQGKTDVPGPKAFLTDCPPQNQHRVSCLELKSRLRGERQVTDWRQPLHGSQKSPNPKYTRQVYFKLGFTVNHCPLLLTNALRKFLLLR